MGRRSERAQGGDCHAGSQEPCLELVETAGEASEEALEDSADGISVHMRMYARPNDEPDW